MIFDTLGNAHKYRGLNPDIDAALQAAAAYTAGEAMSIKKFIGKIRICE